jgi:hypothetical protein
MYHLLMTVMAFTLLLCIIKCERRATCRPRALRLLQWPLVLSPACRFLRVCCASRRMFKYLRLDPSMMLIFNVLATAYADLTSFLVIFVLLLVGFSIVGHFAFGPLVAGFHSPMESIVTCMRFIVGDVQYEELRRANPVLAPIFYMSYAIGAVLVLINVFIAILNEYYTENKLRLKGDRTDFDALSFENQQKAIGRVSTAVTFESLVGNRFWSCVARCCKARLRVHEAQEPVALELLQSVLVRKPPTDAELLAAAALEDDNEFQERLQPGDRDHVTKLGVSHDLTYWVKEADMLRFPGTRAPTRHVGVLGCARDPEAH